MLRATRNVSVLLSGCLLGALLFGGSLHSSTTGRAVAAEEAAAPAPDAPNPFAYTPPSRECTRAALIKATESYIAAQKAGKLSKMSLAKDAKFIEDFSAHKGQGSYQHPFTGCI